MSFNKINITKDKPFFTDGNSNWYFDKYLQDYIRSKQAENLPKLNNVNACIAINTDRNMQDYVLMDNNQDVLGVYPYTFEGFDQMIAKINIIKISKHFDDDE